MTTLAPYLIVMRDRLRNRVVNHISNIRLVDAHAEGDGRDDKFDFSLAPLVVAMCPIFRLQPGVIKRNLVCFASAFEPKGLDQLFSGLLAVLLRQATTTNSIRTVSNVPHWKT